MPARVLALLLAGAVLGAIGQLCFKLGAHGRESLVAFLNVWIGLGLFCYGLGTLAWIAALSQARLTVVYPFTVLTFVLVYGLAVVVLGEPLSAQGLLGVGLVLVGLALVSTA